MGLLTQSFAECLPGIPMVLSTTDLTVKDVETKPTKSLPSVWEGQTSEGAVAVLEPEGRFR